MDCRAAKSRWNWQPRVTLAKILEDIARHAEDNPDWLDLAQG
jgi:hypothetical protein